MCILRVRFHGKLCLLSLVWRDKSLGKSYFKQNFFLQERRFFFWNVLCGPGKLFC